MAEPSPAAEAVLNAITLKRWDVPYQACGQSLEQIQEDVTATLRAVANRLSDEVIVTSEDFLFPLCLGIWLPHPTHGQAPLARSSRRL